MLNNNLTPEQRRLSKRNNKRARVYFGLLPKGGDGMVLHHVLPCLRYYSVDKYIEWDINDLEVMSVREHTALHNTMRDYTEIGRKLSAFRKEFYKDPNNHPWTNKHHTEFSKEKMRNNFAKNHPVQCVETQIVYRSIREATRQMGLKSKHSILCALDKANRTCRGYHWVSVDKGSI